MARIFKNPQTGEMVRLNEQTGQWEDYYDPTAGMSMMDKVLAGAGKAIVDTGRGIGQLFGQVSQEDIEAARRRDEPLMNTGAGMVGNVAGHVATALTPGAALKGAGMLPGLGRLSGIGSSMMAPQTVKGAAALGAGYSALQPGTAGERALNATMGAAGGALGQAAGKYIATGVDKAVTPYRRSVDAAAKKLGARLTPGSETGNAGLLKLEAGIEAAPATANKMAGIKQHNQTILNRIAAKAIGQDADELTGEVLANAERAIGAKFNLLENVDELRLTDDLLEAIGRAEQKYTAGLGRRTPTQLKNTIDDLLDAAEKGSVSGKQYKVWRSNLGNDARAQLTGQSGDRELGKFLQRVVDALDDQAQKSLPDDMVKDYALARQQWRNLLMIDDSMNGANVSGLKLHNRLRKKDKGFKRLNMPDDPATQDLHTMARFADTHRNIVGDSGTATRAAFSEYSKAPILGGGMGWAATGDPATGLMMGAGMGIGVPAMQKLSANAYLSAPSQAVLRHGGLLGMGTPPALIPPIQSAATLAPVGLINSLKE